MMMKSSMPASLNVWRSSSNALAVKARIGQGHVTRRHRAARQTAGRPRR
jgi:hypothetical protein